MSAPELRLLSLGIDHPDRGVFRDTPSHAVLRVSTPKGSLREIHLSEQELERLALQAAQAIQILGDKRRRAEEKS